MQLLLEDVVRLFEVSENSVHRWIQEEGLPVQTVGSRYRFNRAELLEWATARGINFSPAIFSADDGETEERGELLRALEFGGVKHLTVGQDGTGLRALLPRALEGMPLPESFPQERLAQLLLARHTAASTAVGDGIAIPHARYPVLLTLPKPAIRLCMLSEPIALDAPDGEPIDTLFIMVCSTVHEHLRLLAKLAGILRDAGFRSFLRSKPQEQEVLEAVRRHEEALLAAKTA